MKAVIVAAGSISNYEYIKGKIFEEDYIICADGGLRHCEKMGIKPHLLVGDFDSLGFVPHEENVVSLPREKDYSDTCYAALEAEKRGIKEVLVLGGTGSRQDHFLANAALLGFLKRRGVKATLADENNIMFLAQKKQSIRAEHGEKITLVPLYAVKGITLSGFKYPLENANIELFDPVWLSNELSGEVGEISFDEGELLVILAKD